MGYLDIYHISCLFCEQPNKPHMSSHNLINTTVKITKRSGAKLLTEVKKQHNSFQPSCIFLLHRCTSNFTAVDTWKRLNEGYKCDYFDRIMRNVHRLRKTSPVCGLNKCVHFNQTFKFWAGSRFSLLGWIFCSYFSPKTCTFIDWRLLMAPRC